MSAGDTNLLAINLADDSKLAPGSESFFGFAATVCGVRCKPRATRHAATAAAIGPKSNVDRHGVGAGPGAQCVRQPSDAVPALFYEPSDVHDDLGSALRNSFSTVTI